MDKSGVEAKSNTLVDIPQGVTEVQRIGRKCTITNIYLRLNLETQSNASSDLLGANDCGAIVRIMMYWDTQCNGTNVGVTDINEIADWDSFRNLANGKRFRILVDKWKACNTTGVGSGNGTASKSAVSKRNWMVKISKKVFIPIEYSGTTGALSEIRSNNIGLLIWASTSGIIQII